MVGGGGCSRLTAIAAAVGRDGLEEGAAAAQQHHQQPRQPHHRPLRLLRPRRPLHPRRPLRPRRRSGPPGGAATGLPSLHCPREADGTQASQSQNSKKNNKAKLVSNQPGILSLNAI